MKGFVMTVCGEEYDLSKRTPEERAEVEAWYEKNKHEQVPTDPDLPDNKYNTEDQRRKMLVPSSDVDVLEALESLKGNPNFNPTLNGKEQHIALYKAVHPLGGNKSINEAAQVLGINRVTAYRWLKRIIKLNPTADLFQWPTKLQLDVYRLIHPSLGGLTYREAAKALNDTYQHVVDMMHRMRKTHPQAFQFEKVARPKVVRYNPTLHDNTAIDRIY